MGEPCLRSLYHLAHNEIARPLIGGTFVDLIKGDPESSVSHSGLRRLFETYPYLLPNIVTSVLAFLVCGLALGVLDEVGWLSGVKLGLSLTLAS